VIIGFENGTGMPSPNPPPDPKITYHSDELQRLVGTYASEPFGVEIKYPQREGIIYPVIQVAGGVQVPVAVKKDIHNTGGKVILRKGEVMFRTLRANNTVSSAATAPEDWRQIMEICFNNREADLGRFVRRHLFSGELPSVLAEFGLLTQRGKPYELKEACVAFADRCEASMAPMEQSRHLPPLPDAFGWVEIAAVLDPPASGFIADNVFLSRLMNSRPRYSHELWLDGGVYDQKPVPINNGWNALINLSDYWDLREFSRLEPAGLFYVRRPLLEDSYARARTARAGVAVDLQATIYRAAQAMAAVLAFAQALNANSAETEIGVLLRYKGLQNRRLISLNSAVDLLVTNYQSSTNSFEKFLELPADTSPVNLGPFVYEAVREFLALFDGYSINMNLIEQETRRALQPA
jgi:hypothetical protein